MKKGNAVALLPIGVFLAIYLGLGLTFEYALKIEMGFYNIPIVIAFLVGILVACLQNKSPSLPVLFCSCILTSLWLLTRLPCPW